MEVKLVEMLLGAALVAVVPNAVVAAFEAVRRCLSPLRTR